MQTNGIYATLIAQLDKIARHNRQGSFRTKERYYKSMKRFCRFPAEEYHLQKLAKLFVPDDVPTHIAIHQIQGFIYAICDEIQDPGREHPMTHHGLRHSYAARTYQEKGESGETALAAHYQVSSPLGRERLDVTYIYLGSVKKEGRDG